MRNLAGLLLVLLVALVITNMSSFKGLSIIQLDRLNELSVGTDPGGALGITDLDEGEGGAIPIGSEAEVAHRYMGTITNNFDIDIQFDVTAEVRATVFEPSGPPQEWRNINIFFEKDGAPVEDLNFNNILEPLEPGQTLTAAGLVLSPGEALIISLDQESYIHQPGQNTIDAFQAEAFFTITGGSAGTENLTFNLEPAGDLRKQYFSWADDYVSPEPPEPTGFSYPAEEVNAPINLTGAVGYLQYDPESDEARNDWYTADSSELDTVLHVRLDDPESGILTGVQIVKVLVRRTNNPPPGGSQNAAIPSLDIDLRQDGAHITALTSDQAVTDPDGQVFSYYFNADDLNDSSGSNLELWLRGNNEKHGNTYNTVEFGAIEWGYVTE